jgi:hypothetical protein
MNNARQIINRFGGQSSLAALLGKRQSTVQHWARTGRIPSQWQERLLGLAHRRGVNLEARDLSRPTFPLSALQAADWGFFRWAWAPCLPHLSLASSMSGKARDSR